MCRRNQLTGLGCLGFGAGLLIGCWLESGLTRVCLAVIAIGIGIVILQKK